MNFKSCAFIFGFFLIFSACTKDSSPNPEPTKPKVNFSDLEVGQQTAFVSYETICNEFDDGFNWGLDTLLVEVISVEGNEFTFSESFTPNSPLFINGNDTPVEYKVVFEDEFIRIPDRSLSTLYWFYANDTLQLRPSNMITLKQNGCLLENNDTIFIGDDIGKIEDFVVGGVSLKDKIGVSCVPGFFEVDAYLIYDDKGLITSHTVQGMSFVRGWMELERD